ncbi:hypothetical protein [Salinivibrio sharmensis]|uniref:DUF2607 family protein n=1 Tax=Salinivibrio sharmensis TaxID=390883 RepID=A0ABX3KHT7_9GAMM|nr:hypothetical protein [Salinivibrio sharmensis]OOE88370.1 hypothetical protein BZG74_08790 [Salinivibrio sharmensis]
MLSHYLNGAEVGMSRRLIVHLLFVLLLSQAGLWGHHHLDTFTPTHHSEHCSACHLAPPALLAYAVTAPAPTYVVNAIITLSKPPRAYHIAIAFSARDPPSWINTAIS